MKFVSNVIVLVAWAILIAACGGGGGGASPNQPQSNLAPNANAGEDQLVVPPATITLDGGGSSDSDGSIVNYSWNQILGSPIQPEQPDSQIIQFDTLVGSTSSFLVFELSVTDDDGAVSTDRVSVAVRPINSSGDLVTVWNDNLIIRELGADELLPESLFDLEGKTLRFTPEGSRFRVQSVPFQWDPDFGSELSRAGPSGSTRVPLTNFDFSFSGLSWESIFVNEWGNITFSGPLRFFLESGPQSFVEMRTYGEVMIGTVPIISPLFRWFEDDSANRYVKDLPDRIVITWEVSERTGIGGFISSPSVNRFQAVLYESGTIDYSYESIAVRDGIVGVFSAGTEEEVLGTVIDPVDAGLPAYLDIVSVTASLIGAHSVRFDFVVRDLLAEGDPQIDGINYNVFVDLEEPFFAVGPLGFGDEDFMLVVVGIPEHTYLPAAWAFPGDGSAAVPITAPQLSIAGDTISLTVGIGTFDEAARIGFYATSTDWNPRLGLFDQTDEITVVLPTDVVPEEDLSEISEAAPALEVIYEAFYYPDVPTRHALICTVIESLGDEFDFLALYSDFRLDRTSPTQRFGRTNSNVTGLGLGNADDPELYCSQGRFQGALDTTTIGAPQFAENGNNYLSHLILLRHEIAHRWVAPRHARIAGQSVEIGDSGGHWQFGLHTPAAFPPFEGPAASPMFGAFWQDNGDGTFTQLSTLGAGYSYLDLYLMGFLAEESVPDFFIIQNRVSLGGAVSSGNRLNLTVGNYIAENGPRWPAFEDSQKEFNIGFVGIVQNGELPSSMMIERMTGIRQVWLDFWPDATGGVSTMTSTPNPP